MTTGPHSSGAKPVGLLDRLKRVDRLRADAWAAILDHELPEIANRPDRVQRVTVLAPYRDPRLRPAVEILVDGKSYLIVDDNPHLYPVVDVDVWEHDGRETPILTIGSRNWRHQYTFPVAGVWSQDGPRTTYPEVPRGGRAEGNDAHRVLQAAWLHIVIWVGAVLVIVLSLASEPVGSPTHSLNAILLILACVGLLVTGVSVFRNRRRKRTP